LTEITDLKKSQIFIEFPCICPNNLKYVGHKQSVFLIQNIHFVAPRTLLPGAATPLSPP